MWGAQLAITSDNTAPAEQATKKHPVTIESCFTRIERLRKKRTSASSVAPTTTFGGEESVHSRHAMQVLCAMCRWGSTSVESARLRPSKTTNIGSIEAVPEKQAHPLIDSLLR